MLKEDKEAFNCSMRNVNQMLGEKFLDLVLDRNVTGYHGCCWQLFLTSGVEEAGLNGTKNVFCP